MEWDQVTLVFSHVLWALPSVVAALAVVMLGRLLFLHTTSFDSDRDIITNQNAAVGIVAGAFYLSTALTLVGSLFGRAEDGSLVAAGKTLVEGVLAIGLLRISVWINDRLIMHQFCIEKEIRTDRNLGTAFCVSGSLVACGMILNGALTGFSQSFLLGLRDILLFWFVGQGALVLGAYLYQRITRYNVHQLIEYDDNAAVGIGYGGFIVSLGIVLRGALVGSGLDAIHVELTRSALLCFIGGLGFVACHTLSQSLLSRRIDYEEEVEMKGNVAAGITTASTSLAVALLWAAVIQK